MEAASCCFQILDDQISLIFSLPVSNLPQLEIEHTEGIPDHEIPNRDWRVKDEV